MKFTCGNIQNWILIVTEFLCRMRPPWPGFRLLSQETKAEIRLFGNWPRFGKMVRAILSVILLAFRQSDFIPGPWPGCGTPAHRWLQKRRGESWRFTPGFECCFNASLRLRRHPHALTLEASSSSSPRSRSPSRCNSRHRLICR